MDLLEYYIWGRKNYKFMIHLLFKCLNLCFIFKGWEYVKMLKPFRQRKKKKLKMSKEWMCVVLMGCFGAPYTSQKHKCLFFCPKIKHKFKSFTCLCINAYSFALKLNISLKVLPVYVYVLSCKGFSPLKIPIFLMPHILRSHKIVLACRMGHASRKIFGSVCFSILSFVRF